MDGSGLNRTDDFVDQDWIGFNFYRSGLESDWKIWQSAYLWSAPRSWSD